MLTRMFSCLRIVPRPPQLEQGVWITPFPLQAGHNEENFIYPRERFTWPVPLHSRRSRAPEVRFTPVPLQVEQATSRSMEISVEIPRIASINPIWIGYKISWPRSIVRASSV